MSSPHVLAALGLAGLIALAAWRARSLSASGALAATAVGTLTFSASPAWGAYLVAWFVITSALSRLGTARKARHVGAVFAALAFASGTGSFAAVPLAAAAVAALAAAGADTWATEVGTWWRAGAWSLRTGTRVPAGTSGAITGPGSLALSVGATVWSAVAVLLGLVPRALLGPIAVSAMLGAWLDTLLGAWLQCRRHCPTCHTATERRV
ncbi:MAG: DUF92 domain-containing protein, partial [Gemmatimonadaceae bacterium]|nr:DUF92 domain-containing protein [Gemmatimonadaceae bacterium]